MKGEYLKKKGVIGKKRERVEEEWRKGIKMSDVIKGEEPEEKMGNGG